MARPSALAVSALAFAASTFSLFAQSPQWRPVPVANPVPPPRQGVALTPWQNGELLLFGGDSANAAATEWSWNGIRWTPVVTPVPRRDFPAVARNLADGSVWVFGGRDPASVPLLDTWRFANGTWTQLAPATVPQGVAIAMASDPVSGDMVLVMFNPPSLDTWKWVNGDWQLLDTQPWVATLPIAAITDTVRREVLLVSYFNSGPNLGGVELSRLVGGTWQALGTLPPPPSLLGYPIAAFDPERGRAIVLQQSLSASQYTSEWDGLQFGPRTASAVPFFGFFGAVAYHAARRETVLVTGGATTPMQVWTWTAQPQPLATAYGTPCVSPLFALGLAPGDSPQPGGSHRLLATGANNGVLTLSVIGFSHVQNGGLPLPQPIPLGPAGCLLRVEALLIDFLGIGLPAQRLITLPSTPALLGARYDAQAIQFDAMGVTDSSNGLEVQIGLPLPEHELLETFASNAARDPVASGDVWGNGAVAPVAIGGDGRHGSFDPAIGTSLGGGVFEIDASNTLIPAANTLANQPLAVTDGRFFFADFVVPAGTTVRFVGPVPPRVFVRGVVDVRGTVSVDAAPMPGTLALTGPLAGQLVSTFNARGAFTPTNVQVFGQPGGDGGAGGGSGGTGGRECLGAGPILVNGVNVTDGQPGQDVRVAAGHAYAASVAGTGGRGSPLAPALGTTAAANALPNIFGSLQFRENFSPGGSGGGFSLPGGVAATPVIPAPAITQPNAGQTAPGGAAFALLPFPPAPGYSSLEHFLVGGSGGGGGGSHTFATTPTFSDVFVAGHGGSGGGGALALRAGGAVVVSGTLTARGGRGVVITGDSPAAGNDINFGVSSPGGGGSGGSVLLQSAANLFVTGTVDTSGGAGSRVTGVLTAFAPPPNSVLNVQAQAGAGSPGFYRFEAAGAVTFTGTGVPAFVPASNAAVLADQDARSGSRSTWLLPPASALPFYLRYELLVDVGGVPLLFSDDPAVSPLSASDPNGAVLLRFQGARLDPVTGAVVPATVGPWRTRLAPGDGSLNGDRATTLRFDLVVDKIAGPVVVRELRIVWR